MKKLMSLAAALLMVMSFTIASADPSEARHRGRWIGGIALGIAGLALLDHSYRRNYYYDDYYYGGGYYPSYGYYYPRYRYRHHHFRHRHHGHHRWRKHRRHSFY